MQIEPIPTYRVGDKVHSIKIGCKAAFDGVVESVHISANACVYYHVFDGQQLWHRDDNDLYPIVETVADE